MKILGIDTSSTLCSCAIFEDKQLIEKIELNNGLTHSESLMPSIDELFKKTNISLKDISLIVCNIGPGSFTGIRIGVATAKAFSDSMNIPCVGIDSLEVLAYNIKKEGLICSTIDCKNNNCYFALYELKDGNYNVLESPSAKSKDEVLNLLNTKYKNTNMQFIGDGFPEKSNDNYLHIENLIIAGFKKFTENNVISDELLPLYLKKPQAQIQLEEKLNKV